jgi:DNA-binding LacI/PurR family transcriptional regulator
VGFLATNYLLQNGHRKLAFICEEQLHPEAIYMFSGFKSAMEAADIVVTVEKDFLETMRNLNIFKKRVLNFFKTSSHTAWFVRNRTLASRIIAVLQNAGISIPAELSIITVESYVNGSNITAIDNRLEQGCQLGLDILKKNIINPQERQKQGIILLEPEFKKGNTVLEVDR